jgi:hypothetical protein
MSRINKPAGLIRYGSVALTQGLQHSTLAWHKRPRVWIYLITLVSIIFALIFTLMNRQPIEVTLVRAVDAPYQEVKANDGRSEIINHFKVDLRNQSFDSVKVGFVVSSESLRQRIQLIVSNHSETLLGGVSERSDLFIRFPKEILTQGSGNLTLQIQGNSSVQGKSFVLTQEVRLVGPLR